MMPIAWFWGYKWISGLRFRAWFWVLVLFFSILHIQNYDLSAMDAGEWLRVILKECVRIPSALMFSYVRLRHGFVLSVALHFSIISPLFCSVRWREPLPNGSTRKNKGRRS